MRLSLLASLALCASTVAAHATPITYNISNVFSNFSVTGTITTDGNTGTLATADITSWNLFLMEGSKSLELTNSNSGAQIYGNAVMATLNALDFRYGATGYLLFQAPRVAAGNNFLCYQASDCFYSPTGPAEGININGTAGYPDNYQAQSGKVQIGTAAVTPEPGGFVLLGTGLVGLVGVARRRLFANA